jgi:transcriptional regulator with XRE-family HTH domain
MTMSPSREVGKRLKKLREAKGMTQAALAEKADLSRGYLIRLEAGRQDPTLATLERLAEALDMPLRKLIG